MDKGKWTVGNTIALITIILSIVVFLIMLYRNEFLRFITILVIVSVLLVLGIEKLGKMIRKDGSK